MKVNIQVDMTPDEARKMMGLPDIGGLQKRMLDEMERRMKAAVDTSDPEAMLKAWLPLAAPGMVAVHALVPSADVWRLLPELEAAGASSILVVPVERMTR